jgi:hypothetical protein
LPSWEQPSRRVDALLIYTSEAEDMSKALRDPRVNEYRRLASEYEKRADLVDDLKWKIAFFS